MSSIGSPSPFFLAGKKAYQVERSLRFSSGNANYLINSTTRTVATAAYSLSLWVKLGTLSSSIVWIAGGMNSSGANNSLGGVYYYQNKFYWYHYSGADSDAAYTNGMIRDPSAWYHILISKPVGSNGTFYLNGVAQTKQTASSYEVDMFSGNLLIGAQYSASSGYHRYFNGYIAEVNAIDGTALTPSSFTETNSNTGQLVPKKYTGSYGSRGFYLNFSNPSSLGTDYSGNGENFTANNFSTTSGTAGNKSVLDTPTNNFPVLNPLNINPYSISGYPSGNFDKGNLRFSTNQSNAVNYAESSFYFPSTGKWYLEVVINNINIESGLGYLQALTIRSATSGSYYLWWVYSSPYYQINTGSGLVTISAPSNGQVLQLAFDADTGKTWFGNNNTWYLSGDPANGTAMSSPITITGDDVRFSVSGRSGNGANIVDVNFGALGFTYTPPAGFKALCSANLPNPTIKLPNKHFETLTYSGAGSEQEVNGLSFQPDWVWLKERTGAGTSHGLFDSVRGRAAGLAANQTNAEYTSSASNDLVSFDSDGFTVGGFQNFYTNRSGGYDYVAWNWNAGDTDGKTYIVKVHNFSGNNRYIFDNFQTQAVTLDLAEGGTYIFNMDDASNASHPFMIGTTANDNTTAFGSGIVYKLDGVVKTFAQYHAGFAAATTRRLEFTIPASTNNLFYFCYAHSGMGGAINTNSTLGSSNFDGSIQSTVKVNASAGFSIIRYTGSGSTTTVGHGLGIAPKVVIVKRRSATEDWIVGIGPILGSGEEGHYAKLNSSAAKATGNGPFNSTNPSSSVVTLGTDAATNGSSSTYISYCFSEVAGYSKFGSYVGNGSADGSFVFLGFRPAWLMVKRTNASRDWTIVDNKRDEDNPTQKELYSNSTLADYTDTGFDFLSNGFKLRSTNNWKNGNGDTYIFLAFAESPFKNARAR